MYKVKFKKTAEKDLGKVNPVYYQPIIYTIEDDILTVEVIKIDHRSNVYKRSK